MNWWMLWMNEGYFIVLFYFISIVKCWFVKVFDATEFPPCHLVKVIHALPFFWFECIVWFLWLLCSNFHTGSIPAPFSLAKQKCRYKKLVLKVNLYFFPTSFVCCPSHLTGINLWPCDIDYLGKINILFQLWKMGICLRGWGLVFMTLSYPLRKLRLVHIYFNFFSLLFSRSLF